MRIADVLPLTPLQQGLLFHASTAQGDDDLYAVQLDITLSGRLDQHRLHDAVHTLVTRHPTWWPASPTSSTSRSDHPRHPDAPWRYIDLSGTRISMSRSSSCAPRNARRSAISLTRRRLARC